MSWEYFSRFDEVTEKYLPRTGEGETVATQVVTAVCKLVYKWFNDGDVYDNQHYLKGWGNDLSSYANWLYKNTHADVILARISDAYTEEDYEGILTELADELLDERYLKAMNNQVKDGTVYECDGPFRFIDYEEDEEEWW